MRTAHGDVNETIDLTSDDPEIIDIDKYIFEVILVKVVKADPDQVASAVHESVQHQVPAIKAEDGRATKMPWIYRITSSSKPDCMVSDPSIIAPTVASPSAEPADTPPIDTSESKVDEEDNEEEYSKCEENYKEKEEEDEDENEEEEDHKKFSHASHAEKIISLANSCKCADTPLEVQLWMTIRVKRPLRPAKMDTTYEHTAPCVAMAAAALAELSASEALARLSLVGRETRLEAPLSNRYEMFRLLWSRRRTEGLGPSVYGHAG